MNDNDDDDIWKEVRRDVILFETTIGTIDKPIPHPILDDHSKMLRIIANPVYDKLTVSRAANIRLQTTPKTTRQSSASSKSREQFINTLLKSKTAEQRVLVPLTNVLPDKVNSRPTSKAVSKRAVPTQTSQRSTPQPNGRSTSASVRTRTQSIQTALVNNTANLKHPIADGTIRYVQSRYGFEVHRYSSKNCLSVDLYTKDTCQTHEKTFREMLDKQRQHERLSRSIYSSEYYTKRWNDVLQSYKQGCLTHADWAKQNYQLLCLKTLYTQAKTREQHGADTDAEEERRGRARSAYKEWTKAKQKETEHAQSRINTPRSQHTTEAASFYSANSLSATTNNNTEDNYVSLTDASLYASFSINPENESHQASIDRMNTPSKPTCITPSSRNLCMFDEQRWSLTGMVKRIVGLEEPLPSAPKILPRKPTAATVISVDSGFQSVH